MKKALLTLFCLAAMMAAGTGLRAQEVTIVLNPGWNWISFPTTDTLDISEALGSFTPMVGDMIKSKWGYSSYMGNGRWRGYISEFYPGNGYMYKSNRQAPVILTIGHPLPQLSVTTAEPTDITVTSAVVGGTVAIGDGNHIFARGVCWGTEPNPTIDGDHIVGDAAAGSQSFTLDGLTLNTTYYVRAYMVTDYGLSYGEELSFTTESGIPVVTTTVVTDVMGDGATCGGTVIDDGGLVVTARGVCWSTVTEPTVNGNHTIEGTGLGEFVSTLSGLTPSTTYYVRAYATTAYATAYGEEMSFTTLSGIPAVTTVEVTGITTNSAICGGTVTDDGGLETIARGLCWGTTPNPTLSGGYTTEGTGLGEFVSTLSGLTPSTPYYVRAYATTAYATAYGEEMSFTTLSGIPAVTTVEVTGITTNSAICGGTVTDDGGLEVTARGVCWSTSSNPSIADAHTIDGTGTGSFVSTLTGLNPNTTYFFRTYATNSHVTVYGNQRSFATEPLPSYAIAVSSNPLEGGVATGGGTYDQGQVCTVSATANTGYTFTNWTEGGTVVSTNRTYTFSVNADRTLVANFSYIGGEDHAYVDLGLPSGLLWATCNVGTNVPEGYGSYFAWGETQPKNYYDESTYQYNNFNDAATANWGNDWRMPTKEEWQELCDNTTVTWTTRDDVNGRLFTASNGNILFVPAAGYCDENSLYDDGSYGSYWSRSPYTNGENAWYFDFSADYHNMNHVQCYFGQSVRPVRNKERVITVNANPMEGGVVSGGGTYMDYMVCTLTATPSENWRFFNWTENGSIVSTNTNYTFTVIGDRTLVANFLIRSFNITASASFTGGGIVSGGGTYDYGQSCALTATANENFTFVNWTENGSVVSTSANYSFTVNNNRTLVANFRYNDGGSTHAYVDLGLPSGLLWATCNVGADNPEDYGFYFAWGETQPKDTYNWSTYQYCNGSNNTLTKYCNNSGYGYNGFTDNLTTLLPEDDAATANWGNGWRMPTKEEFEELYNNTTVTWTTQNGVNGRLFTASNGNSLFLPAAGVRNNSSLDYAGSLGYYWSSSLSIFTDSALAFAFSRYNYGVTDSASIEIRRTGTSVRPVRYASQN